MGHNGKNGNSKRAPCVEGLHDNATHTDQADNIRAKYRPVWLAGLAAMASGVPTPKTVPPPEPPSGPMSISQSAVGASPRVPAGLNETRGLAIIAICVVNLAYDREIFRL